MSNSSSKSTTPVLTIAIPTFNRAGYLKQNLDQLRSEIMKVSPGLVEVIVSDNCSLDSTPEVVERAIKSGLDINYIRNKKNLGWAINFTQCFDVAIGKYVLLLGDDDLFVDDSLSLLLKRLVEKDYGVVCLRPYGYDEDFRKEYPGGTSRELYYHDANKFLVKISHCFTLTSALVINKKLIPNVDIKQFCTTDLATFHLVLRAALAAKDNLYIKKYLMASKRQNSSSYEYTNVFVNQFWQIIDAHIDAGLKKETVRTIERDKMLSYYPFYLFDLRLSGRGDLKLTFNHFSKRFSDRWLFKYWLAPIIKLPRPFAIIWGGVTTVTGRVISGDLWRGIKFVWNRIIRLFVKKHPNSGLKAT